MEKQFKSFLKSSIKEKRAKDEALAKGIDQTQKDTFRSLEGNRTIRNPSMDS